MTDSALRALIACQGSLRVTKRRRGAGFFVVVGPDNAVDLAKNYREARRALERRVKQFRLQSWTLAFCPAHPAPELYPKWLVPITHPDGVLDVAKRNGGGE